MSKYLLSLICLWAVSGSFVFGQQKGEQIKKKLEEAGFVSFPVTIKNNTLSPEQFALKSITGQHLKDHLSIIASDEMQGRETATPGLKKAARYISKELENAGVQTTPGQKGYYQQVLFSKTSWNKNEIYVNGEEQKMLRNFYAFASFCAPMQKNYSSISFVGYGFDNDYMSHYSDKTVSSIAVAFGGVPQDPEGNAIYDDMKRSGSEFLIKARAAYENGYDVLLIIDDSFKENAARFNRFILNPRYEMVGQNEETSAERASIVFISPTMAENIFGKKLKKVLKRKERILKKKKFKAFDIDADLRISFDKKEERVKSQNIAGFIEGTDPEKKDEVLVLSAHYDHLGKRGSDIYNGADDNGSGTSAVLQIAQTMSAYKQAGGKLDRSLQILFFTGEEKGLLGSQYYTSNPLVPLENIIADINIDMIGRTDAAHEDNANYIYVIGSDRLSMDLHEANERVNEKHIGLELDYTFNDDNDPNRFYYRSDHYNFAKNNIPVIFYFSGV
ncbi:MAG TPA: M28 family peptidase, partial [Saprospiraceae bacterium]|nr:M28 family peptidase [Saprospiraceae bacterium]